jgi:hypothetical protein
MTQTIKAAASPQDQIVSLVAGFWQSRALAVAAELELADLLAEGSLSLDILAEKTKTDSLSLFRLMRALESIGIFMQVSPRVFANTSISVLLRKDVPGSQWAWVRTVLSDDLGQYAGWKGLMGSVQTGKMTFAEILGCDYWQYLQNKPDKWAIFNEAMRSVSAAVTPAVTASYDWSRFRVIADIGGGIGTQLVDILDANPACQGILFDLPEVVATAIPHNRVERIGGDFFKSVPGGADAYILRWVIHDWAEPEAVAILKNVRQAVKQEARLVLLETVLPETAEFTFGKWVDLLMLTILGGRERTATEYSELYGKAGFELEQIVTTPSPLSSIIIGRRLA